MPSIFSRFQSFFFRLLYHQFAWAYDLVAHCVSLGMWRKWISSTLPYLTGPRVLEIGHGPGHLLLELHASGLSAIGLDKSRWMGKITFRRLFNTTPTPKLVNGYAQFLPFARASFDQVVATFPTEFILQKTTLQEIQRILDEGGSLFVLPFAWITGQQLVDRLARWLFQATSQAPHWDERFLVPFKTAGFQCEVEYIRLERSELIIIKAYKPA